MTFYIKFPDLKIFRPLSNMKVEQFASREQVSLLHDRKNATFLNLIFQFLIHRDISHSNLVSHTVAEDEENKYIHKGFIFISLFIQICLKHISAPLKKLGSKLECFLNGSTISNEESEDFISFLGHLDTRLELDKEIQDGDVRYFPALSMMASKLAYENTSVIKKVVSHHWKMKFMEFYDFYNEFQENWTTQAFMFLKETANNDTVVVAFRGTSPFDADDWSTDFDFSWFRITGMGKIHRGFMIALGWKKYYSEDNDQELGDVSGYWPKQIVQDDKYPLAYYTIKEKLKEIMGNNKSAKFIVTGHSLGGALAVLFPAVLALHGETEILDRLEGIYTYGQPRVGDEKFGQFMKKNLTEHHIKYYRIVYGNDIVPTVPWDNTLMTFKHFGRCIHFNSLYQGKIVEEESPVEKNEKGLLKKCLWLLRGIVLIVINFILERINALWELIRGFIIEFTAGPDFREGWLLISARIIGLLCRCVINHNPQDYVNATRLASVDLFLNCDAFMYH